MQSKRQLEVVEWTSTRHDDVTLDASNPSVDAWAGRLLGGAVVLVVHVLLVLSLRSATAITPSALGVAVGPTEDSALIITFINEPARADELSPDGVRPVLLPPLAMPLAIRPPPALHDRLILGEEPVPVSGRADSSLTEASEIYSRQIIARISRGWRKPKSAIGHTQETQEFKCAVQLEQDDSGNVNEVLLQKCNGSDAWQQSLLIAIRSASPLPAPPDRRVFRSSLVLAFAAFAYAPGRAEDEYQ